MKRKLHTPAGALKSALLAAAILAAPLTTQAAQPVVDYSTLQAGEGFRIKAQIQTYPKDVNIIDTDTLDFNGDGFEDILLNVSATINYGSTFNSIINSGLVLLGSNANPAPDVEITSFSSITTATNAITIFNPGSNITPLRLASAGDFNNDGFDDVIIAQYGSDYSGFSTGGVDILLGGPSVGFSNYITFALPTLGGDIATSGFGSAIDGAGDFNGDGIDDIIVGAPGANSGLGGLAYVFLGKSFLNQGRVTTLGPAALGDEDKSAKSINIESVTLAGFTSGFGFGLRVSDAGDFNDDGYDDVLVGASEVFASAPGDYIFFGQNCSSCSPFLIAESGGALVFGAASPGVVTRKFDSAGDFNNDGIDDVVFLAPGGANIYFGRTNATSNQLYYHGNYPSLGYSNFMNFNISNGEDIASIGDVNGDGIDDIIIGAPDQYAAFVAPNSTVSAPGVAYVLFGDATPPQVLYNTELNGSNGFVFQNTGVGSVDSEFGTAVAGGDFNNDGLSDIIASAPDFIIDPSGIFQGGAFVLFGESGTTPPPPDDTEGPVLDFDTIITNSLAFDFTGSVSDPSGVRRVSARIQGNGYLSPAPAPAQSFDDFPTSTNFSFPADLSSLPPAEGIYDISGSARDNNTDALGADAFNDTDQVFTGRFIYDVTPPSFLNAFFDISFVPNPPAPVTTNGVTAPVPDRVYVNQDGDLILNFTDLTEIVTPLLVAPFVVPGGAATISNVSTVDSGNGSTQLVLSMLFPTEGDLEVVIPAGAIGDQAGNVLNQEIRIPVTVDLTDPELLCEGAFRALNSGAEAGEFLTFSIQFTEPVTGVDEDDFEVYGFGEVIDVTPGDGFSDTYNITVISYPFFNSPEANSKLISGGPFGSLFVLAFDPESDVVDQAGNPFDGGEAYAYAEVAYPLGDLPNPGLILSESSETDDRFGSSVAVQGNVAVVGADKAGIGGLAYVFTALPSEGGIRPTGSSLPVDDNFSTFTEFVTLSSPDTLLNDNFGSDVAVSGEWIAVGAPYHDLGVQSNAGAVYVYRRNIFSKGFNPDAPADKGFDFEEPVELFTKLTATVPTRDTRFGTVVELYGNILAVSEPFERRGGAVDIFTYDPCEDAWNFTQRIQPADIFRQDNFGISLALNEDTLVVGSNRDDDRGSDTGSVYVYNLVNGQFILSEKIVPTPAVRLDNVGTSVDINSLLLAFGAPGTDLTVRDSGVIYVYGDENFFQDAPSAQGIGFGDSYQPVTVITTENIALTSDGIGTTVALSGNSIFNIAITAGAPRSDLFGVDNGAAYIYYPEFRGPGAPEATTNGIFSSTDFVLVDVLNTPNPGRNDLFGTSIDSSQTFLLVGAPGATHPEPQLGAPRTGLGSFHNTINFFLD